MVKTRLSRFFLGNLKETERCLLGLACYLPTVVLQAAPPPQVIYAPQPQTGQVIYAQEEPVKGSSEEGGVVL